MTKGKNKKISTRGLQVPTFLSTIILACLENNRATLNKVIYKWRKTMSTPIKPLADRVVAVREEAKTQTSAGIYLPENAKEKPVVAKVVAVGPDVKGLKVGDRIVYKDYSTTDLKFGGEEYLIVKEEDVLATL